jgi:hypothetical protein
MSDESELISKLDYLEAQRRFYEKFKDTDPDLTTIVLYDLDKEIKREKRKLKTKNERRSSHI